MKTPEQIADELQQTLPLNLTEREMMVRAIEADRKQQGEKLYREALDRVKAIKEFREKHEAEYTCFKKTGELD